MFLKDAKSPAKPTIDLLMSAACFLLIPIDVAISPKRAAMSNAEPSAIPNSVKVVLAKLLTALEDDPNATFTLFKLSWKSLANLIAAPPAKAIGPVANIVKLLPRSLVVLPNFFNFLLALSNDLFNLDESPIMLTLKSLFAISRFLCKNTKKISHLF